MKVLHVLALGLMVACVAAAETRGGEDPLDAMLPDQEKENADSISEDSAPPMDKNYAEEQKPPLVGGEEAEGGEGDRAGRSSMPIDQAERRQQLKGASEGVAAASGGGAGVSVRMTKTQEPLDASRCGTVCKLDRKTRQSKCETMCRRVDSEDEAKIDIQKFARAELDAGSAKMVE